MFITASEAQILVNALHPFRAKYPEGSGAYMEMSVLMVKLVRASVPDPAPDPNEAFGDAEPEDSINPGLK